MVQIGDSTLNSILDVLCKIYRGEVRLYNDQCSSGSFIIFQLILTIVHSFLIGNIFLNLQESLCIQFWDKDSFIDGPIRCLLCNLEGEFPFRTIELVRFLSSLCEGTWPAECV